jgi:hypothetical protein
MAKRRIALKQNISPWLASSIHCDEYFSLRLLLLLYAASESLFLLGLACIPPPLLLLLMMMPSLW